MLIDESKMAVDSFFSFLNLRNSIPILNKLKLLFKIETNQLTEQNRSTNTFY